MVRLTFTERWILVNQYRILEHVHPKEANSYQLAAEALERGYEHEYEHYAHIMSDEEGALSKQQCLEVYDILDMFRALQSAYRDLEDQSGIEQRDIIFEGFDGNNETKFYGYSNYLARQEKYTESLGKYGIDSHRPTLHRYRPMVVAWKHSSEQYELTRDDLVRIIDAG